MQTKRLNATPKVSDLPRPRPAASTICPVELHWHDIARDLYDAQEGARAPHREMFGDYMGDDLLDTIVTQCNISAAARERFDNGATEELIFAAIEAASTLPENPWKG